MSEPCSFCGGPVNPYDVGTWKQVMGWVTGPKAHGMTLREYTGKYAHTACINKTRDGQAPNQASMLDEKEVISEKPSLDSLKAAEELFRND